MPSMNPFSLFCSQNPELRKSLMAFCSLGIFLMRGQLSCSTRMCVSLESDGLNEMAFDLSGT
jgi:hypothetical protein